MRMRFILLNVVVVALHAVTFRYAFKWLKNYWCNFKEEAVKNDSEYMELLTFYSRYNECSPCHNSAFSKCNSQECSYLKTLRIVEILGQTKNTLDVCIYLFTHEGFYLKLVDLFNSGVKIRIILDHEMALTNGSKLEQLKESGLNVKVRSSSHVMHHKFFIIDNSLLVTGSLNWTTHAVLLNTEQVLVTNKKYFIERSRTIFEMLWNDSSSIQIR
ncbi:hypothetical protein LSTR_LSTR004668 [Laodelphax striatellus]|uniref:Mitochondrial cardiolipin hydrolase n=1 Tax=Laodelphax striatellus TaxID=195883 RepID=A0A482WVC2_LAOST|nr:hypothetical protein LSTR_LSTR004668 [Laodelphax striatellus]